MRILFIYLFTQFLIDLFEQTVTRQFKVCPVYASI